MRSGVSIWIIFQFMLYICKNQLYFGFENSQFVLRMSLKFKFLPTNKTDHRQSNRKALTFAMVARDISQPCLACTEQLDIPQNSCNFLQDKINRQNVFKSTARQPKQYLTVSRILKQYELSIKFSDSAGAFETHCYLIKKEYSPAYRRNTSYLHLKKGEICRLTRAIVVDWMMEVCSQFFLPREVFHKSVTLLDLYLMRQPLTKRGQVQLIGAACMLIACKIEQNFVEGSQAFAESTVKFSQKQILQAETKICFTLNFHLNPFTLFSWATHLLLRWDAHVREDDQLHQLPQFMGSSAVQKDRFCFFMDLLDSCTIDAETLDHGSHFMTYSFLYLIIARQLKVYSDNQIRWELPFISFNILDQMSPMNQVYNSFLYDAFSLTLLDLVETVQYCSTFFTQKMCQKQGRQVHGRKSQFSSRLQLIQNAGNKISIPSALKGDRREGQ